jgi:hypothetical protein
MRKLSWSWQGFKHGLEEEGIPLLGATIGGGIGHARGAPLTGAALGYALGGGASLLKAKIRGEPVSPSRKYLAGGALGYGAGGLAHAALRAKLPAPLVGKGFKAALSRGLHSPKAIGGMLEEGLPAAGATLGTATAMAMTKKPQKAKTASALVAMADELAKIALDLGPRGRAVNAPPSASFGAASNWTPSNIGPRIPKAVTSTLAQRVAARRNLLTQTALKAIR